MEKRGKKEDFVGPVGGEGGVKKGILGNKKGFELVKNGISRGAPQWEGHQQRGLGAILELRKKPQIREFKRNFSAFLRNFWGFKKRGGGGARHTDTSDKEKRVKPFPPPSKNPKKTPDLG